MLVQELNPGDIVYAAINIVKSSHAADDIAQDAFVRAWEQLPTLRNPKVFGPWLMKITGILLSLIEKSLRFGMAYRLIYGKT